MFTDEAIKAINLLQERVESLERQLKASTEAQKSILLHLREIIEVVAEISKDSSEE